jgi:predicted secreted hydrolase
MRGLLLLAAAAGYLQSSIAAPPAVLSSEVNPATQGFTAALEPRVFEFPRDHEPHPDFRQEWWYLTGNLDATDGQRFGFELTFFRVGLVAPGAGPAGVSSTASAWRTHEIYVAHFAITDVARRRFRFQQRFSRGAPGLAGAQAGPLRLWLDDWSLELPDGGSGAWKLHAAQPGYAIDLMLEPLAAPVLNGAAGLSRKSEQAGDATYYYSIPRLQVRGRLLREGQPVELCGLAWLDREWGSGGLGPREVGWDWFALQLNDGSALMFYALRDQGGGRDRHSAGTFIAADGSTRALADVDVDIAVTATWRNRNGERYPAGWHIRVPAMALDLSVRPALADQELRTTPPYWEGAVDVSGERAGQSLGGRGYAELVGYARESAQER